MFRTLVHKKELPNGESPDIKIRIIGAGKSAWGEAGTFCLARVRCKPRCRMRPCRFCRQKADARRVFSKIEPPPPTFNPGRHPPPKGINDEERQGSFIY